MTTAAVVTLAVDRENPPPPCWLWRKVARAADGTVVARRWTAQEQIEGWVLLAPVHQSMNSWVWASE